MTILTESGDVVFVGTSAAHVTVEQNGKYAFVRLYNSYGAGMDGITLGGYANCDYARYLVKRLFDAINSGDSQYVFPEDSLDPFGEAEQYDEDDDGSGVGQAFSPD